MEYLPNIDYKYWIGKTQGGESKKRSTSIAHMVTSLTNRGILKPGNLLYDTVFDPAGKRKSMQDIWSSAKKLAQDMDLDWDNNKEKLLAIFDAIQLWGGKAGRNIYLNKNKTKGKADIITRDDWENWLPTYYEGVKLAKDNKLVDALRKWSEIDNLGISFTTKHLGFWANSPIYDTRMSRMIFGKNPNEKDYDDYLQALKKIADREGVDDIFKIEQALFTFSQNYFDNSLKKLEFDGKDKKDETEAKKILQLRASK